MENSFVRLIDRGVLAVDGEDASAFLQGLVSNDVREVSQARSVLAALLSPQGKFQFDFIISGEPGAYLLETDKARLPALMRVFGLYKLRSKVVLSERPDYAVFASIGEASLANLRLPLVEGAAVQPGDPVVCAYVDPRDKRLGARIVTAHAGEGDAWLIAQGLTLAHPDVYERLRIETGIPEGSRDAVIDRTILLENGYDKLHGVDFAKGCYVGQEVTARSKHKAELRKKICRVRSDSSLPETGSPVMAGASEIGELRSTCGDVGLALIRLDRWKAAGESDARIGDLPVRIEPLWWHDAA